MSPTEVKLAADGCVRRADDQGLQVPGEGFPATHQPAAVRFADADFVVVMIQVGGHDAFGIDYNVPLKYGVDQCIGDTLGPGGSSAGCGTFRCSPTSRATWKRSPTARDHAPVRQPHGRQLPGARRVSKSRSSACVTACRRRSTSSPATAASRTRTRSPTPAAAINHMDWFLRLEHNGRDLYPELREKFEKPEYYKNEKVRGEVFRHFGYFMTESTGHLSEYVPGSARTKAMQLYCDEPAFGGESGAYYKWGKTMAEKYAKVDPLQFESRPSTAQRRVLLVDHGSGRDGQAVPLHGQRVQRRLHHESCRRLLRRSADLRRRHRLVRRRRRTPAAVRRRVHDSTLNVQQLTADAALTGDPGTHRHALGARPLTVCRLHAQRNPRHGRTNARGPAEVAPRFGNRKDPSDPDHQHPGKDVKRSTSRSTRRWRSTSDSGS
jgi:alpha-galactosidase